MTGGEIMRGFGVFILGSFFGALVGASVAMLFTPYSGDELQARTRQQIETFSDDVRDAYQARMSQLEAELAALRKGEAEESA
jgi:gas vesicle protein